MSDDIDNQGQEQQSSGLVTVLGQLTRRLRSQPLVYGLAILVVLVIAGSLASESLAVLRIPALIIFGVGLLAWLIVEYPRATSASARTKKGIDVRARDVGNTGRVSGIEGLPASKSPPSLVQIDAERIEGDVAGARYATEKESAKAKGKVGNE